MIYCLRVYNRYRFWGRLWLLAGEKFHAFAGMYAHVCIHVNARGQPWVVFLRDHLVFYFLIQSHFTLWSTSWAILAGYWAQGILLPLPLHCWNSKCLLPHVAFSCGFCGSNWGPFRASSLSTQSSLAPWELTIQNTYRITGTIHMEKYPCQLCIYSVIEGS